jgi:NADPH:quinone reductase-like Zn-dependent oxidoreductase
MRAVRYHDYGEPDVLQVDDVDEPTPGPNEVVLSVAAAAVNPVDTYFRTGAYRAAGLPMTTGCDAAGEVAAVGEDVTDYEVGDLAVATGLSRNHQGACADQVAVPTDRLAHLPSGADVREAGAVGVAGVTAYRALVDDADLDPAEDVLIHGGSGGVGHLAIQIGAATGANVVTTAAPTYHEEVGALGADTVLDYDRDDLADAVRAATDDGPDVILDHRLDDYLSFDAEVAAQDARIIGIGENEKQAGFENIGLTRSKDLTLRFTSMFNTPSLARVLNRVAQMLASGDMTVEIAHSYDLEGVSEAHRAVMAESFLGKLVVEP